MGFPVHLRIAGFSAAGKAQTDRPSRWSLGLRQSLRMHPGLPQGDPGYQIDQPTEAGVRKKAALASPFVSRSRSDSGCPNLFHKAFSTITSLSIPMGHLPVLASRAAEIAAVGPQRKPEATGIEMVHRLLFDGGDGQGTDFPINPRKNFSSLIGSGFTVSRFSLQKKAAAGADLTTGLMPGKRFVKGGFLHLVAAGCPFQETLQVIPCSLKKANPWMSSSRVARWCVSTTRIVSGLRYLFRRE